MSSRERLDEIARRRLPRGYDLDKLRRVQRMLASMIVERDFVDVDSVDLVCGLDVAYIRLEDEEYAVSCAVAYSMRRRSLVRKCIKVVKATFPYIPTLLSFREMRPMIMAYLCLDVEPDVIMVDGHGKAHPYRLGIASHIGVVLRKPTIGVAKSLLYGDLVGSDEEGLSYIVDPVGGEIIGAAIKVKRKYVYVSVGNMMTLRSAVVLVRRLLCESHMPIPILLAHNECSRARNRLIRES